MPEQAAQLDVGMMVGEYQIQGELGAGGMGRVYAAIHPVIAKRAAIKVLHPELSRNPDAVERFVQEARSVNQINHPNIVDVFAFGVLPDGRQYFVMEQLAGESLASRLARGPIPLDQALEILDTIAAVLEVVHANAVVHRDLKPDNVFLVAVSGGRPNVKLLDFGIAKLLGPDSVHHTQTGNLLGTPAFISPEQARAVDVDHRTDIYALGAMMFQLLTGRYVFEATCVADMIAKQLMEPPRLPSELAPGVPAALDRLVVRMLAKDRSERPSLAEVRAVLRGAPASRPARTRMFWAIAAGVIVALCGAAIALVIATASNDRVPRPLPALVPAPPPSNVEAAPPVKPAPPPVDLAPPQPVAADPPPEPPKPKPKPSRKLRPGAKGSAGSAAPTESDRDAPL